MSMLSEARAAETLLGIDFGRQRIGVAVGSLLTGRAQPLGTVTNKGEEPDWNKLGDYVREWQPGRIIVGLPGALDGSETDMSARARTFANQLAARFQRPVELVDEQLSSAAAHAQLREARSAGLRRKRLRRGDLDPVAAQLILETWLNEYRRNGQADCAG